MKNIKNMFGLLSLFFVVLIPYYVNATTGSFTFGGTQSSYPGEEFDVYINVTANGGKANAASGTIVNSNNSCASIKSITGQNGTSINGNLFMFANMSGGVDNINIIKIRMYAKGQSCDTKISITDPAIGFTDGGSSTNGGSRIIKINAPKSSNNNLASININQGGLNPGFNPSTTDYNVNVDTNVSSITISATPQDSKSSISGTGTKKLNYGTNSFAIVVKAENGATKTYKITINRKDTRSSDATLKTLSVNGGELSPGFNSNTYSYNLSVPYNISKLNINAQANDGKSKITINNPDLIAEETTIVTIKVTAENGTYKTYTINVSRGKDPNKILSTDNNLLSITPSVGILSPVFDFNKTNYFIYLPYEIETISFDYEISDKKYATVEKSGDERLKPSSGNKFTFSVKAEDESIKTYSVTVYRAENPEGETIKSIDDPTSTQLKSIKIINGKLNREFDPNIYTYTYKKKKDFEINYEAFDDSSYVNKYEEGDNIYIVVESKNGEMKVYCIHLVETNYKIITLTASTIIFALISIVLIIDKFFNDKIKKMFKKDKKKKNIKSKKTPNK